MKRLDLLKSVQSIELGENELARSIRQHARHLHSLLTDPSRLKNERTRMAALKKNIISKDFPCTADCSSVLKWSNLYFILFLL